VATSPRHPGVKLDFDENAMRGGAVASLSETQPCQLMGGEEHFII
jgi:hypothetical protein